jgi:uncharacterized membrane protein (DUF106 family)
MEYEYTIHEMWREPYLNAIQQQMRKAYETSHEEKVQKLNNFNKEIFSQSHFIEKLFEE